MKTEMHILKFITICSALTICQILGNIEDEIDIFIETVLNCTDFPGISLAVVAENQEFLTTGYGVQDIVSREPVTAETLFLIASISKSFAGVSAAIALKNSDGFTWRTPIRDIIGENFYMNDSIRTQHANLRDLYGHRLGLPAHNPIRIAGYSLEELVSQMQYLEFVAEFRAVRMYNNIVYGMAEYVLEQITGRSWKDMVREDIFQPLGMNSSTFVVQVDDWEDVAKAYFNDEDGGLREVSSEVPLAYYTTHESSSGGIVSSAQDMAKWILFQLNEGKAEDGTEILTPQEFRETHIPLIHQVVHESPYALPRYPVTYNPPAGYSTGWSESTYRDYQTFTHAGSLEGHKSHIVVLPDMGTGVFVSVNKSPHYRSLDLIAMFILDHILGVDPWVTVDNVCEIIKDNETPTDPVDDVNHLNSEKEQTDPVVQLEQYVGVYGHYAYGNLTIAMNETNNGLVMIYGRDNYVWDLREDFRNGSFTGQGRDIFWYWKMPVNFEFDNNGVPYVTIWFDPAIPPRFFRDLDVNNPPPPPELCPE